jgi:flavin-dependent dehydrogenase
MVGFVLEKTLSEFGSVSRGVCEAGPDDYLRSVRELTKIERTGAETRNTDSTGRVQVLTGQEIVSMNMWGFAPSIFEILREQFAAFLQIAAAEEKAEFYIPTAVNQLIQSGRGRLKVLRTPESWFGVTYKEDRARAVEGMAQLVAAGRYPVKL